MLGKLPYFLLYDIFDHINKELVEEEIYTDIQYTPAHDMIFVCLGDMEAQFHITTDLSLELISVPSPYRRQFFRITNKLRTMPERTFNKYLARWMPTHKNIGKWYFKIRSDGTILCRAQYYKEYSTNIAINLVIKVENKPFQRVVSFDYLTKAGTVGNFQAINKEFNIISDDRLELCRRWINKEISKKDYHRVDFRQKFPRKTSIAFSPELQVFS